MSAEWKPPEFMQQALIDDGKTFLLEKRRYTDRDLFTIKKRKKKNRYRSASARKVNQRQTRKTRNKIKSATPKANVYERNRLKNNKRQQKKTTLKGTTSKLKKKKSKQNKTTEFEIENEKDNIKSTKNKKQRKKKKVSEIVEKQSIIIKDFLSQLSDSGSVTDNTFLNQMVSDMSTKEQCEMQSILSAADNYEIFIDDKECNNNKQPIEIHVDGDNNQNIVGNFDDEKYEEQVNDGNDNNNRMESMNDEEIKQDHVENIKQEQIEMNNRLIQPSQRIVKIISTEERKGKGIKKKHTVYIIKCDPSSSGISTVARRYNDFKWLRHILCLQFPGLFVPPVPLPKVIGRFDGSFVKERRQDLQRFLNRVEQIKPFSECMAFDIFLSHATETTFVEKRKQIEEMIKNRTKQDIVSVLNALFPQLPKQELDEKIFEGYIPKLKEFLIKINIQLSQINKSAIRLLKHFNSVPKERLLLKESFDALHLTEKYPYKSSYKRFDVRQQIKLWSSPQTKQTDCYYDNFFGLLRYEHQDIKSFLEILKYHQDLYKQYKKVGKSIEKWEQMESNGVQLKLKQTRQKNIDFTDRKQLLLLLNVVTKIIIKHEIIVVWNNKLNLWRDTIQQFSKIQCNLLH